MTETSEPQRTRAHIVQTGNHGIVTVYVGNMKLAGVVKAQWIADGLQKPRVILELIDFVLDAGSWKRGEPQQQEDLCNSKSQDRP